MYTVMLDSKKAFSKAEMRHCFCDEARERMGSQTLAHRSRRV